MVTINLEWPDKTLEFWSGNKFGRVMYENQVAPNIDKIEIDGSDLIEIVFPSQLIFLNFSFVQGFFSELLPKIGGVANFKERIKISSEKPERSEEIQKMIWDKLRVK
ncbi:MAG: hypothetical protein ACLT1L_03195 [Leuconostoc lactis]|uniref:hypothetical protein n=1 Tax=Leuconostoc lactis TaxID=1246 RepID=UPI003995DE95